MSLTFCNKCRKEITTKKSMKRRFRGKDYCNKCYIETMDKAKEEN